MRRLMLFRHGKSDWGDPTLEDFDRPLAPRGVRAASRMGDYVRAEGLTPEYILCSTARRARETCRLFLANLRLKIPVEERDDLYMADPSAILAAVADLDTTVESAMVVAHNPGIHRLALKMSYGGNAEDIDVLRRKFATAALAVIDVDSETWQNLEPTAGRLVRFVRPKSLD